MLYYRELHFFQFGTTSKNVFNKIILQVYWSNYTWISNEYVCIEWWVMVDVVLIQPQRINQFPREYTHFHSHRHYMNTVDLLACGDCVVRGFFYYCFDKTFWWVYNGIIVILMNIYQVMILNNFSSFHGAFGSYFVFQVPVQRLTHFFVVFPDLSLTD